MAEGQEGFCWVRKNEGGALVLTTYGKSSGFCIDPIEKKPLNHFFPGSQVLSFGTAGCNMGCKFCQNWDISKSRQTETLSSAASPEQIAAAAVEENLKSVAFTYNDPVIFLEYAVDTAIECRKKDIRTVAVTAGYICEEPRKEFFEYMDAANIDLKAFSELFYQKSTGTHLQDVLDTLLYVRQQTQTWLEITTLLIPGLNDSDQEIRAESRWIAENLGLTVPLHFSAFHPAWKLPDPPATPPQTLTRAREIAMSEGLRYVFTGNVHDVEGQSTWCHNCGQNLIKRDWYQILEWNLTPDGLCTKCGEPCAGFFGEEPLQPEPTRKRIFPGQK
jgi:pyruvate formate lyase activating enzyme